MYLNKSLALRMICSGSVLIALSLCFKPVHGFTLYGKIYPQWQVDRFSGGAVAGTDVGHMGTLKNNQTVLSSSVQTKENSSDWNWSNSYVGLKSEYSRDQLRFGFDYQLLIDTVGDEPAITNIKNNLDTRDAFVYIDSTEWGRLAFGKMDSIYKDWGDRYPMLGVSSGNFVSTARILSRAAWRSKGSTSFHNRRNNTLLYSTPVINHFQAGASYSFNEGPNGPGGPGTQLAAFAIRWVSDPWYVAVAREIHFDWLPMSLGASNSGADSIVNEASQTRSRDQATRISLGYKLARWRLAVDVSRLEYRESTPLTSLGKFESYENLTGQVSVEYRWTEQWRLAMNYVHGSSGQCRLTGGMSCSTQGLGGYQVSGGVLYNYDKHLSLFALIADVHNRPASRYGSSSQGSDLMSYAAGLMVKF